MNNGANDTISPSSYAFEYDSVAVSYNAIFFTCLSLGILTLLACLCATRRQYKKGGIHNAMTKPSCCTQLYQCSSWLCTLSFYSFLASGLLLIAASAQYYRSIALTPQQQQKQQQHDYSGPGLVRIRDIRAIFQNETNTDDSGGGVHVFAQARVVFGGEWACPQQNTTNSMNRTSAIANDTTTSVMCDTYTTIDQCSVSIKALACKGGATNSSSDDNNCTYTAEKAEQAMKNATHCLSTLTRGFVMPIDNATIDWTVSAELDSSNFPLIEGYWNCDTCTFTEVSRFETIDTNTSADAFQTIGVGLVCGAAGILALWLVVKVAACILMPKNVGSSSLQFEHVPNQENISRTMDNEDWITVSQPQERQQQPMTKRRRGRTRRFNARQWVRSKQWVTGSPIPQAYSPKDDDNDYFADSTRDGLEMIEENGLTRTDKHHTRPEEVEEDDEIPEYWRQWKEETSTNIQPS